MTPRRRAMACIATLTALPFLVFWPLVTGAQTLAKGDLLEQNYPLRGLAIEGWASGYLPLWNSHINGGQPSLADFLSCTFYPVNLAVGLLTWPLGFPLHALELEVLAHLAMAGVFTYLFAREILGSDLAALAAGAIYSLGGYATSYPMEQNHILESVTWLPMILLWLEWAFRRGHILFYVGAGASLGICLLAGHPQIVMYMAFCFGPYWLWRFAGCRRAMHLGGLVCMGLTTAALYLPQIIPSIEMVGQSNRAAMSYSASAAGLAPAELWALLAPVHAGNAGLYVGLVALVLAPLAFAARRWRPQAVFWTLMAILSVLYALGGSGPVFPVLHSLIPPLGLIRQQERALMVLNLAVAVLAGGGLAVLADAVRGRRAARAGLALIALSAAALWLATPVLPPAAAAVLPRAALLLGLAAAALASLAAARRARLAAAAVLFALLVADLATAPIHTALADASTAGPPQADGIVSFLQQQAATEPAFRVSSEGLLAGGPNSGVYFGLEDVVGSTTMTLATFRDLVDQAPELTWWRLLNVRYIVTKREISHGALALVQRQGDLRLYEFYDRLPRAWLVHQALPVASAPAARQALRTGGFAVDRRALVEGGPAIDSTAVPAAVAAERLTPAAWRLRVDAAAPGYVLISQNHYPGWLALVDGRPSALYRANGWQPAVYVSAGQHEILFLYAPLSLLAGLGLSLACVALLLAGLRRLPAAAPPCG